MPEVMIPSDDDAGIDRPKLPAPGPWQDGVMVREKTTGRTGQCRRVDMGTRQFRLVGEPRTMWQSCDHWDPLVEPSAEEQANAKAKADLAELLASLPADKQALVEVFADDGNPMKALARVRALLSLTDAKVKK